MFAKCMLIGKCELNENQRNESTEGVDFGKLKMHSCMYI